MQPYPQFVRRPLANRYIIYGASTAMWYNSIKVRYNTGLYTWRDDATISSPQNMRKRKIEVSKELLQFIQALEKDDVPAVRTMLDANPALVSAPIPDHDTENGNAYPIHCAKSKQMIELLANCGADVNAVDAWNQTPLHTAYDLDTVRLLVSLGAHVDGVPSNAYTPLVNQIEYPDIVEFLISKGADVNAMSEWIGTPLHDAALYDEDHWRQVYSELPGEDISGFVNENKRLRVQLAKVLIEHGADVTARNNDGFTSLHIAAENGFADMIEFLLNCGADADAQDSKGETPLHCAGRKGSKQAVELLLAHGAGVNVRSKAGWYPLEMALMHGHEQIADLLGKNGARPSKAAARLFQAIYRKDAALVYKLIDERPNLVRVRNGWQRLPLHVAVRAAFEEGVRLLLAAGADPNARDDVRDTPLSIAVDNGLVGIAKMLIEADGNVDVTSWKHGSTLLAQALRLRDVDMAKMLVDWANVNVRSRWRPNNETALHIAAAWASIEIIRALVQRGADVNAVEEHGWTAICNAAYNKKISVIQFLIDSGADVNAGTRGNALLAGVRSGSIDVLRFLLNVGADARGTGWHGISALHQAALNGRLDMIDALLDAGARINSRIRKEWSVFHTPFPKGATPLGVAIMAEQERTAERLRERGGKE